MKPNKTSGNKKYAQRSRGKGSQSGKGQPPFQTREEESKIMKGDNKGSNDPRWHVKQEQLEKDVSRIQFGYPVGVPLNLNNPLLASIPSKGAFTIPQVMAIYCSSAVGTAINEQSAINVADQDLYIKITQDKSGKTPFDMPDIGLYLESMADVYGYLSWCRRLYAESGLSSTESRYIPSVLMTAEHVDYDDFLKNRSNFRSAINQLTAKAASFPVPKAFTICDYRSWIYSNVYTELDMLKSQLYMLVPQSFYYYDITLDPDGAGSLVSNALPFWQNGTAMTTDQIIDYGVKMLNAVYYNTDLASIAAWITKTFSDIFTLNLIPDELPMTISSDYNVLNMIKNMNLSWGFTSTVTQSSNKGYLISRPKSVMDAGGAKSLDQYFAASGETNMPDAVVNAWATAHQCALESRLLTTEKRDPSMDEIIEMTRMTTTVSSQTREGTGQSLVVTNYLTCASMVAHEGSIYSYDIDYEQYGYENWSLQYNNFVSYMPVYNVTGVPANTSNNSSYILRLIDNLRNFKFAPTIRFIVTRSGSTAGSVQIAHTIPYQDIDNYTIVTDEELRNIHELVLMQELNVP